MKLNTRNVTKWTYQACNRKIHVIEPFYDRPMKAMMNKASGADNKDKEGSSEDFKRTENKRQQQTKQRMNWDVEKIRFPSRNSRLNRGFSINKSQEERESRLEIRKEISIQI